MEFKIKELLGIKESLNKLLVAEIPIKTSYKLGKIINKMGEELKFFDTKRMELFKKYGELDGKEYKVKLEDNEIFVKEMNELLEITFELEINKIKLDSLGDIKLSALDMANLDKFIEEESK